MHTFKPQYTDLWIVFDKDEVTNFDDIIYRAQEAGINVGWSNPCIEIWLFAYFGSMPTYLTSDLCCKGFSKEYKSRTSYNGNHKTDKDLYRKIFECGDENRAFDIAENRYRQHQNDKVYKPSDMNPATTLHRLVKEIRDKIKSANL